jgi:hypothetical protein
LHIGGESPEIFIIYVSYFVYWLAQLLKIIQQGCLRFALPKFGHCCWSSPDQS